MTTVDVHVAGPVCYQASTTSKSVVADSSTLQTPSHTYSTGSNSSAADNSVNAEAKVPATSAGDLTSPSLLLRPHKKFSRVISIPFSEPVQFSDVKKGVVSSSCTSPGRTDKSLEQRGEGPSFTRKPGHGRSESRALVREVLGKRHIKKNGFQKGGSPAELEHAPPHKRLKRSEGNSDNKKIESQSLPRSLQRRGLHPCAELLSRQLCDDQIALHTFLMRGVNEISQLINSTDKRATGPNQAGPEIFFRDDFLPPLIGALAVLMQCTVLPLALQDPSVHVYQERVIRRIFTVAKNFPERMPSHTEGESLRKRMELYLIESNVPTGLSWTQMHWFVDAQAQRLLPLRVEHRHDRTI